MRVRMDTQPLDIEAADRRSASKAGPGTVPDAVAKENRAANSRIG